MLKVADKIIEEIVADLGNRKGLDAAWENIAPVIREEIALKWVDIVLEHCQPADALRRARRELKMAHLNLVPGMFESQAAHEKDLQERRSHVLAAARAEWELGVQEPPSETFHRIADYIKGQTGLCWTWEHDYAKDGQFAWCGAFAAFCYGKAGLKLEIRRRHMASCYRLDRWSRAHNRQYKASAARPGDILVVGPQSAPKYGAHITIVRDIVQNLDGYTEFVTYEGNAKGAGISGQIYEGVITRRRPITPKNDNEYRAIYSVRFEEEDFNV
jgi:hypothetical protein